MRDFSGSEWYGVVSMMTRIHRLFPRTVHTSWNPSAPPSALIVASYASIKHSFNSLYQWNTSSLTPSADVHETTGIDVMTATEKWLDYWNYHQRLCHCRCSCSYCLTFTPTVHCPRGETHLQSIHSYPTNLTWKDAWLNTESWQLKVTHIHKVTWVKVTYCLVYWWGRHCFAMPNLDTLKNFHRWTDRPYQIHVIAFSQ
jgi:hypothetical protein